MTTTPKAPPYFTRLCARVRRLNTPGRLAMCCFLSDLVNGNRIAALIDQVARERLACPRCASKQCGRHGFANGLQRYRCRACGRTFNGLTGTPLARLRLKDKWLAYCDCLFDPACTVKRAADKVKVHPNTSFRWRHRFLHWVKMDRPATLQGIVEANETFLRESQKGNRHLTRKPRQRGGVAGKRGISAKLVNIVGARDRAGHTIDFIAGRGALTAKALHRHLLPKLQTDVLLVTNADPAYRRFTRASGIAHACVDVRQGMRSRRRANTAEAIHLQNVNRYHGRFQTWLRHFHGVATRYLDNYLGWQWAIDMGRIASSTHLMRAALGCFGR